MERGNKLLIGVATIVLVILCAATIGYCQDMDRYIVLFDTPEAFLRTFVSVTSNVSRIHDSLRTVPGAIVSATGTQADKLRGLSGVRLVEKDIPTKVLELVPWGITRVEAPSAHEVGILGQGISISIIDTGIDLDHPDLNICGGIDYVDADTVPEDGHGHGTSVAGVVAALMNTIGVRGVAPECSLYAIRALNDQGIGFVSHSILGVDWSVRHGMRIASMSLAFDNYSESFDWIAQEAYNSGLLLVAAAGNEYGGLVSYPAAYSSVIAVSATDQSDSLCSFSSEGLEVELTAPGYTIYSTDKGGGYSLRNGTSMACPHVTGMSALIMSKWPLAKNEYVRLRLQDTARDLGASGRDEKFGFGIIDGLRCVLNIPGDMDLDGDVDYQDFFYFAACFGSSISEEAYSPLADLDADGDVDYEDFFEFAEHYGEGR